MSKNKNEERMLKEIQKLHGARDYVHAMKTAQQILKKNPDCAEAMAWTSLFTFLKDRTKKEECIKSMKEANKKGMKNAEVWKISGMLYREMQDYNQFLMCYKLAAMNNPTDYNVISELCNLNLIYNNYDQFLTYARTLLQKYPTVWGIMRYALGLMWVDDLEGCLKFLQNYQSKWTAARTEDDHLFRSEFCLFTCTIMMKLGQYEEAIKYLDTCGEVIRDTVAVKEYKVECYEKLGDVEKVKTLLEELIEYYPENGEYFDILERLESKEDCITKFIDYGNRFNSKYGTVRALELMDVSDERYEKLLRGYLEPLIFKSTPAAYMTLKDLSDEGIELAMKIAGEVKAPINAFPSVKLFRAHVLFRRGEHEAALKELDEGLAHTTTAVELIVTKAKMLRKLGRVAEAVKWGKKMRHADPADRSSNNLYVDMLLLDGCTDRAIVEAGKFAGFEQDKPLLFETQFNTFYLKAALAYLRTDNIPKAREMYAGVMKHFNDYRYGVYNYIGWASKKPRQLVDLIDFLNSVESEGQFVAGACGVLRCALHDGEEKQKETKELALRCVRSKDPELLALAATVLAANEMALPAVRAALRIGGSPFRFLAAPAVERAVAEAKPEMVKEVAEAHFAKAKVTDEAVSFEELCARAEGRLYAGDAEGAKKDFLAAIALPEAVAFKRALKLYVFATKLSKNEAISNEVGAALKSRYPTFEFDAMKTSCVEKTKDDD